MDSIQHLLNSLHVLEMAIPFHHKFFYTKVYNFLTSYFLHHKYFNYKKSIVFIFIVFK